LVGCPGVALGLLKPATPALVNRGSFLLVAITVLSKGCPLTWVRVQLLCVPLLGRSRCSAPPCYCYISSLPDTE
jgi:hypothetical protein